MTRCSSIIWSVPGLKRRIRGNQRLTFDFGLGGQGEAGLWPNIYGDWYRRIADLTTRLPVRRASCSSG